LRDNRKKIRRVGPRAPAELFETTRPNFVSA